jgi:hypothetical protein
MPVIYERKNPWSVKRIPVNWAPFLDGATITESLWVVASGTGITTEAPQISGAQTYCSIGGGVEGQTAYIENRVTLSDGRRDVQTLIFEVTDEVP